MEPVVMTGSPLAQYLDQCDVVPETLSVPAKQARTPASKQARPRVLARIQAEWRRWVLLQTRMLSDTLVEFIEHSGVLAPYLMRCLHTTPPALRTSSSRSRSGALAAAGCAAVAAVALLAVPPGSPVSVLLGCATVCAGAIAAWIHRQDTDRAFVLRAVTQDAEASATFERAATAVLQRLREHSLAARGFRLSAAPISRAECRADAVFHERLRASLVSALSSLIACRGDIATEVKHDDLHSAPSLPVLQHAVAKVGHARVLRYQALHRACVSSEDTLSVQTLAQHVVTWCADAARMQRAARLLTAALTRLPPRAVSETMTARADGDDGDAAGVGDTACVVHRRHRGAVFDATDLAASACAAAVSRLRIADVAVASAQAHAAVEVQDLLTSARDDLLRGIAAVDAAWAAAARLSPDAAEQPQHPQQQPQQQASHVHSDTNVTDLTSTAYLADATWAGELVSDGNVAADAVATASTDVPGAEAAASASTLSPPPPPPMPDVAADAAARQQRRRVGMQARQQRIDAAAAKAAGQQRRQQHRLVRASVLSELHNVLAQRPARRRHPAQVKQHAKQD